MVVVRLFAFFASYRLVQENFANFCAQFIYIRKFCQILYNIDKFEAFFQFFHVVDWYKKTLSTLLHHQLVKEKFSDLYALLICLKTFCQFSYINNNFYV